MIYEQSIIWYVVDLLVVFEGDRHLCFSIEIYHLCVHWMVMYYLEQVPNASDLNWAWFQNCPKKWWMCGCFFFFLEKITSCACLVWSGLNDIFHWYAQSCIFNRSLLSVAAESFTQSLHEKCPNTEFFLVCIFPYLNRIRRFQK